MAIRFLKGKKSPYQVYWNNPFTGRRESASFAQETEAKKHDALIKYQIKYERERFRPEEKKDTRAVQNTLESVYYLYLRDRGFNEKSFEWSLESMRQILTIVGMVVIEDITADALNKLRLRMLDSGIKPSTLRRRFASLKATIRWAERAGIINLCPRFPVISGVEHKHFIPPTQDEIVALLHAAPGHIQRVIVLGSQLGMRVGPSEMFRLTWADVDIAEKVVRVPGARKNKMEPWRFVPIRDGLIYMFEAWKMEDMATGVQHVINFDGKPLQSIKTAWAATLRRSGITRAIRPYDLRHAFATNLLANDVDEGTVARLMGHRSTRMLHEHYQHVSDGQKRSAVERLPKCEYVHENMCTN